MKYTTILFLALFLVSCGDDQESIDDIAINNYINDNGLIAEKTSQGIYYIIDEPGSDEKPTTQDNIEICYEGYELNGDVFDTTYSNGQCTNQQNFPLGGLIEGWKIGLPLFGKGGKGTLIIPSRFAYGSTGNGRIGPNTVIAFDIHLLDFD